MQSSLLQSVPKGHQILLPLNPILFSGKALPWFRQFAVHFLSTFIWTFSQHKSFMITSKQPNRTQFWNLQRIKAVLTVLCSLLSQKMSQKDCFSKGNAAYRSSYLMILWSHRSHFRLIFRTIFLHSFDVFKAALTDYTVSSRYSVSNSRSNLLSLTQCFPMISKKFSLLSRFLSTLVWSIFQHRSCIIIYKQTKPAL